MSILWKTFDRPKRALCAQRFLNRYMHKPHTLQIHFSDETARRARRTYQGAVAPTKSVNLYNRALERENEGILRRVQLRALEIVDFIYQNANEETEVILSTGLEDTYTNRAYRILHREIKKNIPSEFLTSRNPLGKNENAFDIGGADFIELHSFKPRFTGQAGCIASLDGYRIDFDRRDSRGLSEGVVKLSDVSHFIRRHRARGCHVFLWWPGPQGRGEAKFVEPRRRDFRIYREDVSAINRIIRRFQ